LPYHHLAFSAAMPGYAPSAPERHVGTAPPACSSHAFSVMLSIYISSGRVPWASAAHGTWRRRLRHAILRRDRGAGALCACLRLILLLSGAAAPPSGAFNTADNLSLMTGALRATTWLAVKPYANDNEHARASAASWRAPTSSLHSPQPRVGDARGRHRAAGRCFRALPFS